MFKKIVSVILIIITLATITTIFSSCSGDSTREAESYLKGKYHQTFEQARNSIYTRGNNSTQWFFKDNSDPDVVFTVTKYDGKFHDNRNQSIQEKQKEYEIEKFFNDKNITVSAFVHAMNDSTLEQNTYNIFFVYLAVNIDDHTEDELKEVFKQLAEDRKDEKFTFDMYLYDKNSYENIVKKYFEIYDMNATYMEDEDFKQHYSVRVEQETFAISQMK